MNVICAWHSTLRPNQLRLLGTSHPRPATAALVLFIMTSLQVMSEKIDVMRLTFYTAPISCACLLPFLAAREWSDLVYYSAEKGVTEISESQAPCRF